MTNMHSNLFAPSPERIAMSNSSDSLAREFRFCPVCASPLHEVLLDGVLRQRCSAQHCGFVHYRKPAPGAGILLVENHRVLLVCRAHEPKAGHWSLPAGFMECAEHPSETARREALEETGLEVELTRLFDIYHGQDDPRTNAILVLYEARHKSGELRAGDDASEVAFFPMIDLPEQIAFESHRHALRDYIRFYSA